MISLIPTAQISGENSKLCHDRFLPRRKAST
jgi:hypothetical protein